jgi:hypothetical protein
MLGEDEHRDAGMGLPDLSGCDETTVLHVSGRHADIDDRDVGAVRAHLEQEVISVRRPADYLVTCFLEQQRNAFAQEGIVVRNDDSEGLRGAQKAPDGVASP